jgi:dUTP pyrophosphatase
MSLYIYVEDPELREKYRDSRRSTDSGVDIFMPTSMDIEPEGTTRMKLGIVVGAKNYLGSPAPCLLLPRSSISKTPLRLANSIGLIDSGYRGEVCAAVDNWNKKSYSVEKYERLFQICSHDFLPFIRVVLVERLEDLPVPLDDRGSGGFGSTGK